MSRTRRLVCLAAAALGAAVLAPAAQAGVLVSSASACEWNASDDVFLEFADVAQYVSAPGGSFESGAPGWSLGGASVVAGNEPWEVRGADHSSSLSIPSGASVVSPATCVGLTHPTLRFFNKKTSGGLLAHLDVDVLFEDSAGNVRTLPIGDDSGSAWHPTAPMVITPALLPLLPGDYTAVAFRFTAHGGRFQIDDVEVDPWGRH